MLRNRLRTTATFSPDIAYSDSPAASRAWSNLRTAEAEYLDSHDFPIAEHSRSKDSIFDPGLALRHQTGNARQDEDLLPAIVGSIDLASGHRAGTPIAF